MVIARKAGTAFYFARMSSDLISLASSEHFKNNSRGAASTSKIIRSIINNGNEHFTYHT